MVSIVSYHQNTYFKIGYLIASSRIGYLSLSNSKLILYLNFKSLSQEHPERNLFYNPAVNANAFKGYEDGDNERRLFQAPAGYIHDPAKKAIPEAGSLEANIFGKKPFFL